MLLLFLPVLHNCHRLIIHFNSTSNTCFSCFYISELLELFQWKTSEEAIEKNLDNMKDELADVLIYAILFANETQIDIEKAINEKNKEK
ncbi:MazG-like family protein [Peribacillus sp. NPDC097225]|uniref:MazG-like family protein n=1 Tax=Peribacillus sp. NPDC097225 TaxID=3364400 RepID=UPI00382B56EF